jgi:hypothetical protein
MNREPGAGTGASFAVYKDQMARRVCLSVLFSLSLAACSSTVPPVSGVKATASVEGSAFAGLAWAPLKLPRVGPGQSCPVSTPRNLGPQIGPGKGSGPVFVFGADAVLSDPASSNKIVWASDPSYSGPIRIRGARIDGAGQLLLDTYDNRWRGAPVKTVDGTGLVPELDLLESHSSFPNVPTGWRMWPSGTYVSLPGCYAWQVDGVGFTELIIFHSLDLRSLAAGAACPVSPQHVANTLSSEFGGGPALGSGPIYALMGEMRGGWLQYSQSANQGNKDGWAHSKVLWMARPGVTGTVLIRGRQIDAPIPSGNWVGFGVGDVPDITLSWEIGSQAGWANLPSEVWISGAGCYAFQVDGQGNSEVIVFKVVGVN